MTTTLEEQNASLRNAVLERLNGTPAESCCEGARCTPATPSGFKAADIEDSAAIRTLKAAIEAVRDRHKKYGPPCEHFGRTVALINAAFGTTFKTEDWPTIMMLDKIARSRGPWDHPDNDIDAIGYAACRTEVRDA
jgi:hypothetical protein